MAPLSQTPNDDAKHTLVLLIQLGSPRSLSMVHISDYLREFLMDPWVLDLPYWQRALIVYGLVVPFRTPKTREAYQAIWTRRGSPLVIITHKLTQLLAARLPFGVDFAMRYGSPSIEEVLRKWISQEIRTIFALPLYPHYTLSTYKTAVEELKKHVPSTVRIHILRPYYNHPQYIHLLAELARPYLPKVDHLLFSFHGVPLRHLYKADPTQSHCLKELNCCTTPSPAHKLCYRYQVLQTTEKVGSILKLPKTHFSFAFQSRFGRDRWTEPEAEEHTRKLVQQGTRSLAVMCPGFSIDCLETLEEINLRLRQSFLEAGGKKFYYIPCLNTSPQWVEALSQWIYDKTMFWSSQELPQPVLH